MAVQPLLYGEFPSVEGGPAQPEHATGGRRRRRKSTKPLVALIYSVEQLIIPTPMECTCPMFRVKLIWLEVVEENTVKAPNTVVENTEKVLVKVCAEKPLVVPT